MCCCEEPGAARVSVHPSVRIGEGFRIYRSWEFSCRACYASRDGFGSQQDAIMAGLAHLRSGCRR